MPLYEYQCTDCTTRFEVRRAIKDIDAPAECPRCHSPHTTRQVSAFLAFSKGGSAPATLGGSGCASCSRTACSTCAARN
jgi:putative FmdB family regulatory protein